MVVSVLPGGLPVSQSGHAAAEPSQARAATRRVEERTSVSEQRSALTARTVWHPEKNRQAPSSSLSSQVALASGLKGFSNGAGSKSSVSRDLRP